MREHFRLFIFIFMLCLLPLRLNGAEEESYFLDSGKTISMDFQDADLKDILKILSIQSGLNFIASEAVQDRKITLYLDKVPLQGALDKLFKANNLSYELDKQANIFSVRDWGKPELETVTKIFFLKYATVSSSSLKTEMAVQITPSTTTGAGGGTAGGGAGGTSSSGKWRVEQDVGVTNVIKKILSTQGSVIEDYRTNSLIVTDIPSRMPIIEKTIAALDVPVPQVMLEVEMLDVSKNVVDALGFEYGESPFTLIFPGGLNGFRFFLGSTTYRGLKDVSSTSAGSTVFGRNFGQLLDFLRTQTDTRYLARPRLLTLNNETAEIKITTQESIGVTTTTEATSGTTSAKPERTETGVSLRITPQINLETKEITMFIYPQVSEATAGNTLTSEGKNFQFRDPEIRSTKSIVKIKDNETVVIGGLIRNELQRSIKKLPILGDIPILGPLLFTHKGGTADKNKERELLVFITPHIIKDTDLRLTSEKKIKLPLREQNIDSGFNRQAAIDTALNSLEKPK